jgi:translation initiation factor 5A
MSTAKTGKHGAAKAMLTGIDIFTSNKIECTHSTSDTINSPITKRIEYTLSHIEDEFVHLMDEDGNIREDLKIPEDQWLEDVAAKLKEYDAKEEQALVTVLSSLGIEKIIHIKDPKQ